MTDEPKKESGAEAPKTEKNPKDAKGDKGDKPADAAPEAKAEGETEAKTTRKKKSKKRKLLEAHVHIQASYNNTMVSICELNGDTICWASSGSCGFKGTRKATPYAASVATETALNKAKALGVERVHITIKGIGSGRDQALRAVNASGVAIESISDKTAIPHNGCRARKARRI